MFQWDKSVKAIDVPADKVLHLFRSMREVQLALPGVSAQQASSFLCQYQDGAGVSTVAVFHLHKSKVLSFYFSDPRIVPERNTDSMLDQGLNFVESMGFLMTDQDIHLLDANDQVMLWESLPLKAGLEEEEETLTVEAPAPEVETKPAAAKADVPKDNSGEDESAKSKAVVLERQDVSTTDNSRHLEKDKTSIAATEKVAPTVESKPEPVENVDDLLAAVEAMRAKRPGLRARKSAPSPEEMENRRLQLRATVGRIWASL